jgi:hypothetical protein
MQCLVQLLGSHTLGLPESAGLTVVGVAP